MTAFARYGTTLLRSAQVVILSAALTGCAALRRPDPPVDRSQDARIQQEVEARMAVEPGVGASEIRVEVDGGIVILHGSVKGIAAWQCAIRNASLVPGVRTVTDFLVIERASVEQPCLAERSSSVVQQ